MDEVRSTFVQYGHDDLVEMLDKNDTRVIDAFLQFGVAYSDDVRDFLNVNMGIKFREDVDVIIEKYPDFRKVAEMIGNNISDQDAEFNPKIVVKLLDYDTKGEVSEQIERCMTFYNSFYLDPIVFDPFKNLDVEKEDVKKEPELVKINTSKKT
tara:strand:+ start:235 stop:693 length:459 start_codon:yes stop_codon:yes gene_type:complete